MSDTTRSAGLVTIVNFEHDLVLALSEWAWLIKTDILPLAAGRRRTGLRENTLLPFFRCCIVLPFRADRSTRRMVAVTLCCGVASPGGLQARLVALMVRAWSLDCPTPKIGPLTRHLALHIATWLTVFGDRKASRTGSRGVDRVRINDASGSHRSVVGASYSATAPYGQLGQMA